VLFRGIFVVRSRNRVIHVYSLRVHIAELFVLNFDSVCVCVCVYIYKHKNTYKVTGFQIGNAHSIREIKQGRECNFGHRELALYFACDYSLTFSVSLTHIQIRIELSFFRYFGNYLNEFSVDKKNQLDVTFVFFISLLIAV